MREILPLAKSGGTDLVLQRGPPGTTVISHHGERIRRPNSYHRRRAEVAEAEMSGLNLDGLLMDLLDRPKAQPD
jgi:hypothetical protein